MPLGLALATVLVAASTLSGSATPVVEMNSIGMRLVRIPDGSFLMGSPADEAGRRENEGPQRRIRITRAFYMGQHEVTRGQFRAFVEATGHRTEAERDPAGGFGIDFTTGDVVQNPAVTWHEPGFPGFVPDDTHPVMLVSWSDAEAFCAWLSAKEGVRYRLPTEAEWEYAARGGTSTRFSSGDPDSSLRGFANLADADLAARMPAPGSVPWRDGHAWTAPVGSYAPNAFGLHDMHGNVWEWCLDWFGERAYDTAEAIDPRGPVTGRFRTIRGGGWFNPAHQNRSAARVYFDPTFRYCLLSGFRVVREL